ncbi:MAG: TRAP transporter small permease subunit, partial [Paracoccaceae bacterium]
GGHAAVDVFTARMSARANRVLAVMSETLFAVILVVIAVQLARGLGSKYASGQTSFLIEFPLWWAYAASLSGGIAAAMVAAYLAVLRWVEVITGSTTPSGQGAEG